MLSITMYICIVKDKGSARPDSLRYFYDTEYYVNAGDARRQSILYKIPVSLIPY